jgi:hypothetical protein
MAVALLVAAAWAASPGAAAEKPRDYRKELRQAESQQRSKRYRQCIALCDSMLAHFKESWQVKEVTRAKIEAMILDTQYEAALGELAGLAKAFADDKRLGADAALRTGDVQRMLKKFDEAVATYRKLADGAAGEQGDQAAEALLRAGEVLCTDLKKPQEGIARYQEVEAKFGPQQPRRAAEALRRIAAVHEAQTKDALKAAAAYRAITGKYATAYDERTLASFYGKAIDCLLSADKPAEAIAAAGKAEASLKAASAKASFGVRHADVLVAMKKFPAARAECGRVICSYPLEAKPCQAAQARIVEAYRAEGKWAEALGAARVLYDAAGDEQGIRSAAQVVAQAFLAADANLGRANEFLSYQRFGPAGPDGKAGTDDDVAANHLAKVKYPPFSSAANAQFQAAVKAQPRNYDGHRAKAFLYVYWGRPKDAAGSFLAAFKAANLAQVSAASQELVLIGMKAHTASFRGLDRIFEYISHGPKGKSGKENIRDPFAGLH